MALQEKLRDHQSDNCVYQISCQSSHLTCSCHLKNTKCQLHGNTRGKVRGSLKSVWFILWGPRMLVQNFIAIHPTVVEKFQSGSKWCTWWDGWKHSMKFGGKRGHGPKWLVFGENAGVSNWILQKCQLEWGKNVYTYIYPVIVKHCLYIGAGQIKNFKTLSLIKIRNNCDFGGMRALSAF